MATSKATVQPVRSPAAAGSRAEDLALVERCRKGELGAFETIYRTHSGRLYSVAVPDAGQPGRCGGPAPGDLPRRAPEARELPRRIGARHVAVPAGDEPVPRPPAQPGGADRPAHRRPGRRAGAGGRGTTETGRAHGGEDGSRAGAGAAAGRVPRGIRAARRRRARTPRGRRRARHRGRHVEVAGAQGAVCGCGGRMLRRTGR